jgi:hypothetical protein
MTPTEERKPAPDIYKTLTITLASIVVTLIGAYFLAARNVVTKEELPGLIQQYSPYTVDSKDIKTKLDELRFEQIRTTEQVRQLQIDTARIGEKLGVPGTPAASPIKRH